MSITKTEYGYQVYVASRKHNIRFRRIVKNKKEAIELEAEIRTKIKRQTVTAHGIEQGLEKYLKGEAKILKDYTGLLSKARTIRPYIIGKTFHDIGEVASTIKEEGLAEGLKPATINRRLALLRRLGNLAYEWGWIENPIGKRIKLLSGETQRHYYLSFDDVHNFAKLCPVAGDAILAAAYSGLRKSELLGLKPENIQGNFIMLDPNTKTGKPRAIPIPEQVKHIFKKLPLAVTPDVLRNEFEAAREVLKLKHIRFHDLRHSYASFLAQAGANLHLIGEAMGHSTPSMTARYSHLVKENLKEITDKFEGMREKSIY
ncbi:site-specific integrase [Candidatus Pacearchaeota archaeon]|nr:site-specific integrase [Candidatus Pacearchaeota archaeon]